MNFSFQFVCSPQIKMYQESGFWGHFFVLCTAGSLELPAANQGSALDPLGGLWRPPDNQLLQAMIYGHCISCFLQDTTFIHALTTNLAHHSKFLKKRPVPWLSGVSIATSLSGSTEDFLKLSFHLFLYNEILKSFQSKI